MSRSISEPSHAAQQDRRITHRARHGTGLVKRGGKGDDPPARTPPIRGLHTDDAAERGWLPD